MEEFNLLKKLESFKAPPDFEQKVMAQLSLRKRKERRIKHLRLSLAGACGTLLVFFIVMGIFILPKKSPVEFAGFEKGVSSTLQRRGDLRQSQVIPIIEAVDYAEEMQILTQEPPTIYLLEQVSNETNVKIKY